VEKVDLIKHLGFRVQVSGFRVQGVGCKVKDVGFGTEVGFRNRCLRIRV